MRNRRYYPLSNWLALNMHLPVGASIFHSGLGYCFYVEKHPEIKYKIVVKHLGKTVDLFIEECFISVLEIESKI